MITVHHLGVSQSERIVWLCEELDIDYELKLYPRDPETMMAPESYRKLHPMGIAPIISDDELVLAESGAIIEYIITRYGKGRLAVAPDHKDYADYLFWFHFANGTLIPIEMFGMLGDDHALAEAFTDRGKRAYNMIDNRLGESAYFAGDELTAADINMFFALTTMRNFSSRDLSGFKNIKSYLQRVGNRSAYKRAMEKSDPGMALLLE